VEVKVKDTKTRYQGVFARHQMGCALEAGKRCNCTPRYYGVAWDRNECRQRKTRRFDGAIEARDARADLLESMRKGTATLRPKKIKLKKLREQFLQGVRDGVVLNKYGRRYRKRAIGNLESSLNHLPQSLLGKSADAVRRGEIQALVDSLAEREPPLSGSRIRSVVNAIRSLYRFAKDRELATHNPAQKVRLPAPEEKVRDRVATPAEFAALLTALECPTPDEHAAGKKRSARDALRDAVPYALAAYGTARNQEIKVLDWTHVHFQVDALELAANEEGRKPGGSWRIVPVVAPLLAILRAEWEAQGRPKTGKVCPPRKGSKSGLIALDHVQERVHHRWRELGLEPIGFHEARHTAATWLDHAGVSPKVSSEIMGHKTPQYQPGAARITLQRYTHMLPGELERAREQLEAFLKERTADIERPNAAI
jgi:integrase